MGQLIATLTCFPFRLKDTVHSADGAVILALIQQRGIDLRGRRILKTFLVKAGKNRSFLGVL